MTPAKALAIFGAKYLLVIIVGIALIYFLRQPRPTQRKMLTLAAVAKSAEGPKPQRREY